MTKKLQLMLLMMISAIFMFAMIPSVAFATNSKKNNSNTNTSKDFAERFTMDEDGKLNEGTGDSNNTKDTFNKIFEKYRGVIAGVSGIVAISMLLFFIVQAFRLGSSAHNASERQKAIQGLIWLGIATAISGSVSLFTGLFYGMLK